MLTGIQGYTLVGIQSSGTIPFQQPVPLAKGRKRFDHLIDIIGPDETDAQALARIEAVFENERQHQRLFEILRVMES